MRTALTSENFHLTMVSPTQSWMVLPLTALSNRQPFHQSHPESRPRRPLRCRRPRVLPRNSIRLLPGWEGIWWQEISATWMEDVAYPEVDDYLKYLSFFMQQPWQSLEINSRSATRFYGAAIFAEVSRPALRACSDSLYRGGMGPQPQWTAVELRRGFRSHCPRGLRDVVREFAAWKYFAEDHYQESHFYPEGYKNPEVSSLPLHSEAGMVVQDSGRWDHLGSTYIRLEPQLRPG